MVANFPLVRSLATPVLQWSIDCNISLDAGNLDIYNQWAREMQQATQDYRDDKTFIFHNTNEFKTSWRKTMKIYNKYRRNYPVFHNLLKEVLDSGTEHIVSNSEEVEEMVMPKMLMSLSHAKINLISEEDLPLVIVVDEETE